MRKIFLGLTVIMFLFSVGFVAPVEAQAQPSKKERDQARKLANDGDKFFRQKNYRMAVDRYQKASVLIPNFSFPALYYNKGYSHYSLQQYDLALEALTTALNQGYTPIEIYKIRWILYYEKKDYDNSLRDAEEVAKIDPKNSTLLMSLGDMYSTKNMAKEAIDAYEKAELIVPNNGDLQYSIAFNYARLGNTTQQGVVALKAIQNNTRFLGDAWFLVANSFQIAKKNNEAIDAYERAISAKPTLIDAYNNLALVFQTFNRIDDAIAILKKGADANPNDGGLYINLTWFFILADRSIEAIGAGKKAISLAPDQFMGHTNLCRAYNAVSEYETAIQICNNALKLKPNDGETNLYLARSYDGLKKTDIATSHYKKAVAGLVEHTQNNPGDADGFNLLGNAYVGTNQIQLAIDAYKKCLELNPKTVRAIYNLGYMYVSKGDKASARLLYNELIKLDTKLAARLLEDIQGK